MTDLRGSLVTALEADLIGPFEPGTRDTSTELLPIAPSRWYLTGFLAPQSDRDPHDPTADDELGTGTGDDDDAEPAPEPEPKQKNHFPASMGMSVFLPPGPEGDAPTETVRVTITFAEYIPEATEVPGSKRPKTFWRRVPQPARSIDIPLVQATIEKGVSLPDTAGIRISGELEVADAPGLPKGTRALSLFVVNTRTPGEATRKDEQFIFQVEMSLSFVAGFVERPNRQGEGSGEPDDETADLQFRHHCEWAVGHGVAVQVVRDENAARPTEIRTTWIPQCEVRKVDTHEDENVVTAMEDLAAKATGEDLASALRPVVDAYGVWLDAQESIPLDSDARKARRKGLLKNARRAKDRIAAGIELLAKDAQVREAFQWMNAAMASAARKRSPHRYAGDSKPSWRLFQLAFVLLNLVGISDPSHPEREEVELIFFPTGGGKTEAYLGVIGFTLLLRRMRGQSRPDGGLGVAVLLRYTLRLLTLDQLGRAATLVCALELLRQKQPAKLGEQRFAVGLWVGRSATANTLDQVKKLVIDYKNSASKTASSPFPLSNCPWCQGALGKDSLVLHPNRTSPTEVVVSCVSPAGDAPSTCEFSPRSNREGLPVLFVDEQIYRELPCFLVATVDKFAMLPWRGETGLLFGRTSAREGRQCFGPLDKAPKTATKLPHGFLPPELVVQDELHLISGPLGTMVGLYETAIEWLSTQQVNGKAIRPKVIASTATVRRARAQIRALFGRPMMSLFPPPGVDASETFFAKVDTKNAGRLYVGVAAPGRQLKAILLRTYVALLAAGERHYSELRPPKPTADAYMTVAGYFNSLRELGGMRRLVEDDVRTRASTVESRVPEGMVGRHPWGRNRTIQMPVELTSREKAGAIKAAKDRLNQPHASKEHVDVLLASNMISVGVDIDRLGLMVVAGQPKTTSEYIQASSRVGRQHPGLVVTCFNVRRPRDRSHYERFVAYHESFYRYVEAASLTPFSGPALDRGLTGTLVSMVRHGDPAMTAPTSAMAIAAHRAHAEACVAVIAARAGGQQSDQEDFARMTDALKDRGTKLLDAWTKIAKEVREEGATKRSYSKFDLEKTAGKPLLFTVIDDNVPDPHSDDGRFAAPTSMRDVEPSVHLWIERRQLGGRR
ncbi:MAG: DISARM system helicase DrmA [Polyangiaceae bacterium]